MPIKTLHITNAYHEASGGISTFYRALLEAANRQQRYLRLIVPGAETRTESVGEFGRIHHLAAPRTPLFDRRYRLLLPHTYLPPFAGALRRVLQAEKPDLVEICDKYSVSWLAGLLRRRWLNGVPRPVLVGLSCERMDDNLRAFVTGQKTGGKWAKQYLGQFYLPLFDYHVANSSYTAGELHEAMLAEHQRPVHVLPMGADIEAFAAAQRADDFRQSLLQQVNGQPHSKLLLYAGRLSPEKNVALLLEMLAPLTGTDAPDVRLLVAGSGPLADWFAAEAQRRFPGRVLLLGHIRDRKTLINLYAACDAFVHPNPREPFGIAPLEAMAAGLPLIAPRSGGVLSYANDHNAWLTNAEPAAFAAAVRSIFADPAMRKDKLARARWTAAQYRWPDVTARFFALYDELHADFSSSRFAYQLNSEARLGAEQISL